MRSTWLILGVTLILLFLIEVGFRIRQRATGGLQRPHAVPEAYAKVDWFNDYNAEYDNSLPQRWKPYLYFARYPNIRGKYINTDSLGHRVTPQPTSPAVPKAKVFFFGGSTMWGDAQREDHTIAAETSRRLQELAGAGNRIEVTNFGEGGYVSTQGLLGLELELRKGNVPDVVVFYDGINDVFATVQVGAGGTAMNEMKRVAEFDLGRQLDRNSAARGPKKDFASIMQLLGLQFRQLATVDWVLSKAAAPAPQLISLDSATNATVHNYLGNVRMVEALGREYGFTPVFVWQTSLQATPKPLTPFEARRVALIKADASQNRMLEVHRLVPAILDTAMQHLSPGRFVNESGLFRTDSSNVFADHIGHNTEQSIPTIVDGFWPQLKDAVTQRMKN